MFISNINLICGNKKIVFERKPKWIKKNAKNSFAYKTKEEALKNFYFRTKKRIRILKSQIEVSEKLLEKISELKNDGTRKSNL